MTETTKMFSITPPKMLHHYTNGSALLGICQNKELWAGSPDQMNDSTEQTWAVDLMEAVIRHWVGKKRWKNKYEEYFLTSLDRIDLHDIVRERMPQYTVSLTKEPDLLSQWRAYCPRSGGYSFGMPVEHLRVIAEPQRYALLPCIYTFSEAKTVVSEILAKHVHFFALEASLPGAFEEDVWTTVSKDFAHELAFYGTVIKNVSFAEEQEWRLIYLEKATNPEDIVCISGDHGLKLFHKFYLEPSGIERAYVRPKYELKIGPNARRAAAVQPAYHLMKQNFGEGNFRLDDTISSYR
ncbi:DUF2971 domain-containing protein [Rhodococcus erythropolis]|uniref:DUF2971 domain-containing protein n=1 Tax=Rhodococcus erythropolis TaxID=1833 RepID=UPI00406BA1B7